MYPLQVDLEPSLYDRVTEQDQYEWDQNERLQDLSEAPFLCPPCFVEYQEAQETPHQPFGSPNHGSVEPLVAGIDINNH